MHVKMTSVSSETSLLDPVNPSSKPWFLTFNDEFKELFIWKNGRRMQLKDGSSSGPVSTVSAHDVDGIITVS